MLRLSASLASMAVLAGLAVLTTGCGDDAPSGLERGPRENVVAVAAGPTRLLAEALVGADHVRSVAPAGADMATWRPADEALDALVGARQILVIGAEFEPWVQRAGLPPSRTLTLAERVGDERWIEVGALEHTHGGGASHSHGGVVPTVWTDPVQLRAFVAVCAQELPDALDGVDAASLKAARRTLELRIDAYEEALAGLRSALGERTLIATDHGLEYIARAAGIELTVVLLEMDDPGQAPNDQGIRELETLAAERDRHAGVLVWPGRLDGDFATAVHDDLGLVSVHFDLGGTLGEPDAADTLQRLMNSLATLRTALLNANPR